MSLPNEILRIYRESGLQKEVDQAVTATAHRLVEYMFPQAFVPGGPPVPPSPPMPPPFPGQRSPYEVLGVSPTDPMGLIEGVYKAKIKFLHPDVPTGDAQRFMAVQQAYQQIMEGFAHGNQRP